MGQELNDETSWQYKVLTYWISTYNGATGKYGVKYFYTAPIKLNGQILYDNLETIINIPTIINRPFLYRPLILETQNLDKQYNFVSNRVENNRILKATGGELKTSFFEKLRDGEEIILEETIQLPATKKIGNVNCEGEARVQLREEETIKPTVDPNTWYTTNDLSNHIITSFYNPFYQQDVRISASDNAKSITPKLEHGLGNWSFGYVDKVQHSIDSIVIFHKWRYKYVDNNIQIYLMDHAGIQSRADINRQKLIDSNVEFYQKIQSNIPQINKLNTRDFVSVTMSGPNRCSMSHYNPNMPNVVHSNKRLYLENIINIDTENEFQDRKNDMLGRYSTDMSFNDITSGNTPIKSYTIKFISTDNGPGNINHTATLI